MTAPTIFFDLSDWSVLSLTGPDRASYLHSFCTNDIKKLKVGEVCEAFVPDVKGRILGHLFVCVEAEALRLISVPEANQILAPHLTKYLLGVEAEVHDQTSSSGLLCLVGNQAHEVLKLNSELELNQSATIASADDSCRAMRVDLTNSPTYLVSGPLEQISDLKNSLSENGLVAGRPEEFHRLRIEAGFPFSGVDVTDANIAQEAARTEQAISFTKGCYLGQEPIARLDAMGHTNKELRGFVIDSSEVEANSKILFEEKEVGSITSVAELAPGKSIALGIIRVKQATPGQSVVICGSSGTFPASVFWPRYEQ